MTTNCELCAKPVSSYNNEGNANVCFVCRDSEKPRPIWLILMESGDLRLSLDAESDCQYADGPIKKIYPTAMPTSAVALLHDLEARTAAGGGQDEAIQMLVWDTLPTMIFKTLRPQE